MSTLRTAVPALLFLALASNARALPDRVFASARTGSDANDCSLVATPCQSLQGAIGQVAAGGVVLVLDTGGYGPVTIDKSVSIEAPPGIEAFIHPPSGNAITVAAGGNDVVVLRGLTLSAGNAAGIDFRSGASLYVERCAIQGFDRGIVVSLLNTAVDQRLFVEDTVIRGCATQGLMFNIAAASGHVTGVIDGSTFEHNDSAGIDILYNTRAVIHKTVVAGSQEGILVEGFGATPADAVIVNTTVSGNSSSGIWALQTATAVRIARSTITNNGAGIRQQLSPVVLSRTNNTIEGNSTDLVGTIGTYSPR